MVLDIIWDYFLSINSSHFSGEKLEDFTQNIYTLLEKNYGQIQEKVVKRFESMIAHNFLLSCSTIEALDSTFRHLQKRTKFKASFDTVTTVLQENHEVLNASFLKLFPQMIEFVELNCEC